MIAGTGGATTPVVATGGGRTATMAGELGVGGGGRGFLCCWSVAARRMRSKVSQAPLLPALAGSQPFFSPPTVPFPLL